MKNNKFSVVLLVSGLLMSGTVLAAASDSGDVATPVRTTDERDLNYEDGRITPRSQVRLLQGVADLESQLSRAKRSLADAREASVRHSAAAVTGDDVVVGRAHSFPVSHHQSPVSHAKLDSASESAAAPAGNGASYDAFAVLTCRERLDKCHKEHPNATKAAALAVAVLLATEATGRTHVTTSVAGIVRPLAIAMGSAAKEAAASAKDSAASAWSTLGAGGFDAHVRTGAKR